ncbi:hypothetical protein GGX14DRAFT_392126 [Mycena pura]|uniref:Uncharacterized protein n=1 Tax=Mycena pura TaxID=153505 RepID=A0AAD6VKI4_9AGAR|nr:hypothetical protein GGX14DRAFT_392126 [Mycena pura]
MQGDNVTGKNTPVPARYTERKKDCVSFELVSLRESFMIHLTSAGPQNGSKLEGYSVITMLNNLFAEGAGKDFPQWSSKGTTICEAMFDPINGDHQNSDASASVFQLSMSIPAFPAPPVDHWRLDLLITVLCQCRWRWLSKRRRRRLSLDLFQWSHRSHATGGNLLRPLPRLVYGIKVVPNTPLTSRTRRNTDAPVSDHARGSCGGDFLGF